MLQVWTNSDINGPIDSHQYDIIGSFNDCDIYAIHRSSNPSWTNPGEPLGSIQDGGNGVLLQLAGIEVELEYDAIEQLLALLLSYKSTRMELRQIKTIKSI